ncbi:hypothetical protein F4778DRAFT_193995 [Xylariomycetidae sp. FL2044]|nr:hypothetical protein F4778DRAFT_193995 [Xylariomycetidae sp. FL2044]
MATSVKLHPRRADDSNSSVPNPLPQLIQTPSGLAILELQGTINLPDTIEGDDHPEEIEIGRISFPDYHPDTQDPSNTSWMKRVHLYVGHHQRLTGEVKKLPRAMAIIRKKPKSGEDVEMTDSISDVREEELEIVEIVKHKLVFSQRPEPVGTG